MLWRLCALFIHHTVTLATRGPVVLGLPALVPVVLIPIYAHRDRLRANRFAMIIAHCKNDNNCVFALTVRITLRPPHTVIMYAMIIQT